MSNPVERGVEGPLCVTFHPVCIDIFSALDRFDAILFYKQGISPLLRELASLNCPTELPCVLANDSRSRTVQLPSSRLVPGTRHSNPPAPHRSKLQAANLPGLNLLCLTPNLQPTTPYFLFSVLCSLLRCLIKGDSNSLSRQYFSLKRCRPPASSPKPQRNLGSLLQVGDIDSTPADLKYLRPPDDECAHFRIYLPPIPFQLVASLSSFVTLRQRRQQGDSPPHYQL